MLYTHRIIDNVLFCSMTKINKIRNNLIVHKDIENGLNEKILKEITEDIDRIQPCVETLRLKYSKCSK
jgi:archaellum component FlaC